MSQLKYESNIIILFLCLIFSAAAAAAPDDPYFEDDYITPFAVKEDADFVSDIDHLTVPARIEALSIESLEDDSGDENVSSRDVESKSKKVEESGKQYEDNADNPRQVRETEGLEVPHGGQEEENAVSGTDEHSKIPQDAGLENNGPVGETS